MDDPDNAGEAPLFAGIGQLRAPAPMQPARKFVLVAVLVSLAAFAWPRLFPPTRYTVVEIDMGAVPEDPVGGGPAPAPGAREVPGAEEGPPSSATPPPDRVVTPPALEPSP